MVKCCTKCDIEYPKTKEYFAPDKRAKDGLCSWCRKCQYAATNLLQKKTLKNCREKQEKWHKTLQHHRIPNYLGYWASKDGRIWSDKTNRWLKPGIVTGGRLIVALCIKGKAYTRLVHRLILEAFVGFCPEGMETCHYDDNPMNNSLENLRWDTPINNAKDKRRNGNMICGEGLNSSKLKEQDVRIIIYMWRTKLFKQKEIAKIYKIRPSVISRIVNKKAWKHIWR